MKVLVVEDNDLLGRSLKQGLAEHGWTVDLAVDGEEGLYCAENSEYHMMLVDHMLPKLSGLDLITKIRGRGKTTPAIMITARGSLHDRVHGLEVGADDYIVKPFAMAELVARMNAVYRRSIGHVAPHIQLRKLTVDLHQRRVTLGGEPLLLTPREYDLLLILAGKPGYVFSRGELGALLYEFNEEPESNSIDVLLARVRKKIADSHIEIATVRGKGFTLRVESAPA